MKKQTALSIGGHWQNGRIPCVNTKELNDFLMDGWIVASMINAHISGETEFHISPVLIILEKDFVDIKPVEPSINI